MRRLVALSKALADEGRLRILGALGMPGSEELCVCQLTELLGLAPSTVSRHLTLLRRAGLVTTRKEGRWVHCRLAGRGADGLVRRVLELVARELAGDPVAARDAERLRAIGERRLLCGRPDEPPAGAARGRKTPARGAGRA